jgi:signal peptidase I
MERRTTSLVRETVETVLIAVVLALVVRTFVVESFQVQGHSMEPTLHDGERLLVSKFVYRFTDPARGDIVVFRYPLRQARPGDGVRIERGRVYVNGQPLEEPYVLRTGDYSMPERIVPPGQVFVLGDNRMNSEDSRYFGFVPIDLLVGRALLVYWPPDRVRLVQ